MRCGLLSDICIINFNKAHYSNCLSHKSHIIINNRKKRVGRNLKTLYPDFQPIKIKVMTKFKLHCEIEAGWASLTFTNGDQKDAVFFSQLFDGLNNLLDAVLKLNDGEQSVESHLFADAESFVFEFTQDEGEVLIRLFNFHEWTENQPLELIEHRGINIFEESCTLFRLSTQTARLFTKLRKVYGAEGYAQKWGHEFPSEKLARLQSILQRRRANFFWGLLL